MTLFDSTGLAIQDLAVTRAALQALRERRVEAQTVELCLQHVRARRRGRPGSLTVLPLRSLSATGSAWPSP